jgi:hypothetical protein
MSPVASADTILSPEDHTTAPTSATAATATTATTGAMSSTFSQNRTLPMPPKENCKKFFLQNFSDKFYENSASVNYKFLQ